MESRDICRGAGKETIKLIGLDLDGTTLSDDKNISKLTLMALEKAYDRGIEIVIATGRAYHSLPEDLKLIKGLTHVVTSNGAAAYKYPEGELYLSDFLRPEAVEEAVKIIREHKFFAEAFVDGRAYIDKKEYDDVYHGRITYRDREYVLRTRNKTENLTEFMLQNRQRLENITINFPKESMREDIEALLNKIKGINLTTSFPYNFEFGNENTSKGNTLKKLLEKRGLTRENLLTAGDSPNDESMIEEAAIGIAMGSGHPHTISMADFVADSNSEEGLAKALDYILDLNLNIKY